MNLRKQKTKDEDTTTGKKKDSDGFLTRQILLIEFVECLFYSFLTYQNIVPFLKLYINPLSGQKNIFWTDWITCSICSQTRIINRRNWITPIRKLKLKFFFLCLCRFQWQPLSGIFLYSIDLWWSWLISQFNSSATFNTELNPNSTAFTREIEPFRIFLYVFFFYSFDWNFSLLLYEFSYWGLTELTLQAAMKFPTKSRGIISINCGPWVQGDVKLGGSTWRIPFSLNFPNHTHSILKGQVNKLSLSMYSRHMEKNNIVEICWYLHYWIGLWQCTQRHLRMYREMKFWKKWSFLHWLFSLHVVLFPFEYESIDY
jgi:hypothetical protein